ncbi:MAG TPA: NAD(P)-dependent oxidoreductase [Gaiellales bacterium]|jgi:phosphoglycerate dehydrogenase-like enzyme
MSAPGISVLYLPHPEGPRLFDPWGRDVVELVGARHDLRIFDRDQPHAPQLAAADAVIDHGGASGTHELADAAGRTRLWQILGTGFDHFDLEYWRSRAIPVANCPGALTAIALADAAMMLLLMVARRFPESQDDLREGRFYTPAGTELAGLRLCIVGYGASGRELARRAVAFGMIVAAIDVVPLPEAEREAHGLAFAGAPGDLDEQLALADAVSLHLHLDATTRHTIDARRLALMKRSAFIVNVSRGELVDEDALIRALTEGGLGGAGLDTFAQEPLPADSPLLSLPNVVVTPHIAGVTAQASRRRAAIAAENVDRVAAGLEPLHRLV